jgi:protein phosphatase
VQVDVEGPYPLEDGDTFVLCSDGLSNQVPPDEIGAVVGVLPLDEAGRFLIELANLRGGPDNITVLIVRVGTTKDSFSGTLPGLGARVGSVFASGTKIARRLPWPIAVLTLGFLLAVLFVICAANGWHSGATLFFATAGVAIAIGIVGLFLHTRRQQAAPPEMPEVPPRASIYRQYPVRIDAGLVDRWTTAALQLKEQLEARDWAVDWPTYRSHAEAAARSLADGDLITSFRHHCRALGTLATPFNQQRPKEESFRPKWESSEH